MWTLYVTIAIMTFSMTAVLLFAGVRRLCTHVVRQARCIGFLEGLGCLFTFRHRWDSEDNCLLEHQKSLVKAILGAEIWLEPSIVLLTSFNGRIFTLAPLSELSTIVVLELVDCPGVTDDIFDILVKMHELRIVNLTGCPVSARGAKRLAELPRLKCLCLADTEVTFSELASLRDCLPGCKLEHDQDLRTREREVSSYYASLRREGNAPE